MTVKFFVDEHLYVLIDSQSIYYITTRNFFFYFKPNFPYFKNYYDIRDPQPLAKILLFMVHWCKMLPLKNFC